MPKITSRDGQTLNYIDIGPKSAPVCVLVHGFGMQASHWLPLILPLITQYRFILPDLRGFGGSINAQHNTDCVFETFAHDLHDVIEHLSVANVALAGFSMGGMTSLMYQRLYGTDKLRAYLQIDQSPVVHNTEDWPWGLYGNQQTQKFDEFREMYERIEQEAKPLLWSSLNPALQQGVLDGKANFIAGTLSNTIAKQAFMGLHKVGLTKLIVNDKNWPAYRACMSRYSHQQADMRDVFNNYSIPLWVFAGEKSELYDIQGQRQMAALVEDSTFITFKGKGHALPYEAPVKFVRSLSAFIRSTSIQTKEATCLN